jgi:hypothetical protein
MFVIPQVELFFHAFDKLNSIIKYLNYNGDLFIRIRSYKSSNEEERERRGKK